MHDASATRRLILRLLMLVVVAGLAALGWLWRHGFLG